MHIPTPKVRHLSQGFQHRKSDFRFYNTLPWFPLKDFLLLLVKCSYRSLTFPRLNRTTQMQRGEFIRYLSMSVPAVVTKCRKLGSGVGCQRANIYFSWFWSLKVWNQVAGRFRVCCGLVSWSGESCLFSVSPGGRREWALWPMLMPPVCVCVCEKQARIFTWSSNVFIRTMLTIPAMTIYLEMVESSAPLPVPLLDVSLLQLTL